MKHIAVGILAVLLCGPVGCGQIRSVSSWDATNLEGSPGTANDLATGGGGNRGAGGGGGGA